MAPRSGAFSGASSISKNTSTTSLVLLLVAATNVLILFLLYNSALPSEVEPISHPNATKAKTASPRRPPQVPPVPQRRFDPGHGLQGFIRFSAYRVGEGAFVATGLAALQLHSMKQASRCTWTLPNGTLIGGRIRLLYPGEHHGRLYETILLRCDLAQPALASLGGMLLLSIDKEEVAVYSEAVGSPEWTPPGPSFPHDLTYCSPPLYGALDPARLHEWLRFHQRVHQVDFFHLYDAGGVEAGVLAVLQPYLRAGQLDVTDILPTLRYDTWLYSQVLVVNDCALRTQRSSRWALMMDLDEYLNVVAPPHRLLPFLTALQDLPWLSIGSLSFSTATCAKGADGAWAVERMVLRDTTAACRNPTLYPSRELCLKWDGHRKYCINPRQVEALQIHRVMEAQKGGLNLHTSLLRMNHYRGLGVRDAELCRRGIDPAIAPPKGFVRDTALADMATAVRQN